MAGLAASSGNAALIATFLLIIAIIIRPIRTFIIGRNGHSNATHTADNLAYEKLCYPIDLSAAIDDRRHRVSYRGRTEKSNSLH